MHIVITVVCILLLKLLFAVSSGFPGFYFHRLYVWISLLLRQVTGWIPFSIGDLLYAAWFITAIVFFVKVCYKLIRRKWQELGGLLLAGLRFILGLYLAFMVLWGYNYQRRSLAADMQLNVKPYKVEQLQRLADTLLQQVNSYKAALGDTMGATHPPQADSMAIFQRATAAFEQAGRRWPSLQYRHPSIKPSLYGKWLNYTGVGGYLNPFTSEAQVNTTTPGFLLPFGTCHEIAHQLGYAPEEEANFVGYLAANSIADNRFRYAAAFEMFLHSVRQLSRQDTTLAAGLWERALPGVKADYRQLRDFYARYRGPLDNYTAFIYDQYLKANRQEAGIRSYSEVVGWLIAYYRLSGE